MNIYAIITIIISFLGLIGVIFGFVLKISNRLTKVESDSETFWKVLGPHMAEIIHSPEHKDRDELVDKLVHGVLPEDEALLLMELLEQNIHENHSESKKLASALLLARLKSLYGGASK